MCADQSTFRTRWRALRKNLLSFTPFVKRSRHQRALARVEAYVQVERRAHQLLGELFFRKPALASTARFQLLANISNESCEELCLFVTHATSSTLKPHVIDHVEAMLDANIAVLLVANSDVPLETLCIPEGLRIRLHGCMVRENLGYDFGAWAHAYSLIQANHVRRRLMLVNDSIVGPLDRSTYNTMLEGIRRSRADLLGLTSHPDPHDHLQSYFLIVNERLLHSEIFDAFMKGIVNMPDKQCVIDVYELWFAMYMREKGFIVSALFPNLSTSAPLMRNDTLWEWKKLIDNGFPFIKSAVLTASPFADEARELLPRHYAVQERQPEASVVDGS